jgi:hypothetical protein
VHGGSVSWAAALKAAYYPHLRALSLDNCNGGLSSLQGSTPRCLLARGLQLLDLAETALSKPGAKQGPGSPVLTLEDHHARNRETTNNQKQQKSSAKDEDEDEEAGSDHHRNMTLLKTSDGPYAFSSSSSSSSSSSLSRLNEWWWSPRQQQQQAEQAKEAEQATEATEAASLLSRFRYSAVLLMNPDLVLLPQGPSLVADLVKDHTQSFKWPFKCDASDWNRWQCVGDALVSVPGDRMEAFRRHCLGRSGCHADGYGDEQKVRFDTHPDAFVAPFSGRACFRCVSLQAKHGSEFVVGAAELNNTAFVHEQLLHTVNLRGPTVVAAAVARLHRHSRPTDGATTIPAAPLSMGAADVAAATARCSKLCRRVERCVAWALTTTEAAAAAAGTSMASCSLHAFVSGRRQAQGSVAGILAESEVMTGRLANGRRRLPLREEEDKDSSRAGSLLGSVLGFAKPNEAYGKQRGSYGGSAGQKYFRFSDDFSDFSQLHRVASSSPKAPL